MTTSEPSFTFYGGAAEFAAYKGPEALLHGPAETGKTISACYKIHLCALKYPEASLVIARKTLASTYATVLQTYRRKVLGGRPEAWGIKPYGGEKPEWFDYPNGARLWITGLDKSSKTLSAEHDLVYVNQVEELNVEDWEILTTRTTGRAGHMPYAQTIGDANPAWPSHWMYHRDSLRTFTSQHADNPILFDPRTGIITAQGKRTMAVLDALTGVRKERLRWGRVAQAEGAIYTGYDEATHRIYREAAADHYPRYVAGVDWGYRNPGSLGVWGVTGEGAMYLVAQYYHRERGNSWWVEKALQLDAEFGIEAFACDPSQPAYIQEFRNAGLNAVKGFNEVRPGIDAVESRFETAMIFFLRDSLREADQGLIQEKKPYQAEDEIPNYIWANNDKEQPVKQDDHGLDMTRYAVAYVDRLGEKLSGPPAGASVDVGLDIYKSKRKSIWA